jgi:hypothetical protein
MISQAQVEALREHAGVAWITALKSGAIRQLVAAGTLQMDLFDERNLFECTHDDFPGERLIACRNPQLAKLRAAKRCELLAATTAALETVQRMVTHGRLKDPDKIGVRVGRVINQYKMAKHLVLEISATQFAFHINEESVAAEAALDGLYVIRTALPAAQISSAEAVRHYKGLSHVEAAFRSLKSDDLQIRPIYHHTEERVRAHLLLCMLAYYVKWHMGEAWRSLLFADEDQARLAERDPVAPATRSDAALAKVASKRLADGSPAHSFRTLLNALSTIVRNTCRRKNVSADEATFNIDTTPNPKQQAALDLIKAIHM